MVHFGEIKTNRFLASLTGLSHEEANRFVKLQNLPIGFHFLFVVYKEPVAGIYLVSLLAMRFGRASGWV